MLHSWEVILGVLSGQAMFLAAVGWLVKALITKWIQQDAEKFKNQLQKDAQVEIEQLKHSLQRTSLEHQVRFTKLHEKRASVIADLYERMVKLSWTSQRFVYQGGFRDHPSQEEEFKLVSEEAWGFADFVDSRRIYLPDEICNSLDAFTSVVRETVVRVGIFSRLDSSTGDSRKAYAEVLLKAVKAFEVEIPKLRKSLETEFRAILVDGE